MVPSLTTLKPSPPSWQAYDQRCSSPSLTDGPHQLPGDHIFQSEWHGLSRKTPDYGSRSVAICEFYGFHWPFQTLSLWED